MVREAFARALRERLNGRLDPEAARAIDRVADMSSSTRSLLWLLGRSARDVRGTARPWGSRTSSSRGSCGIACTAVPRSPRHGS